MDYRWSPIPDRPLKGTERYRKVDGIWKMHTQAAMEAKDLDALFALIGVAGGTV